jgi:hypothetical protein
MTRHLLCTSTALLLVSTTAVFAEGGAAAPAPGPVLYAPPAMDEFAYVELTYSHVDLSNDDDNDSDFDASSVPSLSGQALMRFDSVVLEVQGNITGDTGAQTGDRDEVSSSFGAFGHYLFDVGPGELGAFAGITGGQAVEEDQGVIYGLFGMEYGFNGFVVAAAYADSIYGDDDSDDIEHFYYLQAGYTHQFNDAWSLGVDGLYGMGQGFDGDDYPFYELTVEGAYDLNDNVRLFAGISHFGLQEEPTPALDSANGTQVNLGVSFAIGGNNAAAREAIPFDTPTLHRIMTWTDEM